MANPLYNQMAVNNPLLQRFKQFQNSFRGNPQQQVQQLLNSGKVTQEQYNRAVQLANQMRSIFGL